MSTTVDNRVVKMTFDNAQFEKNIKTTLKTLRDFEQSLELKGATAGFDKLKQVMDKFSLSSFSDKFKEPQEKITSFKNSAVEDINEISKSADRTDLSSISDSAIEAANGINKAVDSVDMTPVQEMTDNTASRFSALEAVAFGVFSNIGQRISNFAIDSGKKLLDGFFGPIKDGFKEYETQIGSVQTILANTGMDFDSDEDIAKVNAALDKLNEYADQTIYKFTDMTQAIGTFTSAGLKLEEAVSAVKGVSNVAAYAGAGASEVHRVLPQISQALSAGNVTLQDWKSIETANMASRGLVEAIGDMAVHMAKAGKAADVAAEAGQALIDKQVTMREALNGQDNKAWKGWFSSDILAETLTAFTYDLRTATAEEEKAMREHLASLGYQEDEMESIFQRAEMATRAATEVRTWDQLFDTLGETIGSNWTGIWRNILGDFKDATELFTFLSNELSGIIDRMFSGIINAAKVFNMSGAREIIFGITKIANEATGETKRIKGVIDYLLLIVTRPMNAIKGAFKDVFNMNNDQLSETMVGLAQSFRGFVKSLVPSKQAMSDFRGVLDGVFSIVDLLIRGFLDFTGVMSKVIEVVRIFVQPIIGIILSVMGGIGRAIMTVRDLIVLAVNSLKIFWGVVGEGLIPNLKKAVDGFFKDLDIGSKVFAMLDIFDALMEILLEFLDIPKKLEDSIEPTKAWFAEIGEFFNSLINGTENTKGLGKVIQDVLGGIGSAITTLFPFLGEFANRFSQVFGVALQGDFDKTKQAVQGFLDWLIPPIKNAFDIIVGLVSAVGGFFVRTADWFTHLAPIQGIISSIKGAFDGLIELLFGVKKEGEEGAEVTSASMSKVGNAAEKNIDVIGSILEKLKEFTDFLNGLSFTGIINNFETLRDSISNGFKGAFDYLVNTPIDQKIADLFDTIKSKSAGAFSKFRKTVPPFDNFIKEISDDKLEGKNPFVQFLINLRKNASEAYKVIKNFGGGIKIFAKNAIDAFKQTEIGQKIFDGFSKVFGDISKIDFGSELSKQFENVKTKLQEIGQIDILGSINNIANYLKNTSIPQILSDVGGLKDRILEYLGGIGTKVGEIFKNIKDNFPNIGSMLDDAMKNVGSLFGLVKSESNEASESLKGMKLPELDGSVDGTSQLTVETERIPSIMETLLGNITGVFGEYGKVIGEFDPANALKEKFDGAFKALTGFDIGDTLQKTVGNGKQAISDFVTNLFAPLDMAADKIEDRQKLIETVLGGSLILSIRKFLKSMSGMADSFKGVGKSLSDLPKTLGSTITEFAKNWNKWRQETPAEAMLKVSGALIILAGALWVISQIPTDKLQEAGVAMGTMAVGLVGVIGVIGLMAKLKLLDSSTLTGIGTAIGGMGIGILALAGALWVISQIPQDGIEKAMEPVKAAIVLITLAVSAIAAAGGDKLGGEILKAAIGLVVLNFAIRMLLKTITKVEEFDLQKHMGAVFDMAVAISLLGFALKLAGPNALKAAAGLLILSFALLAMMPPIWLMTKMVESNGWQNIVTAAVIIGGFVAVLSGALRLAGKDALKASVGLLILSAAMLIIVPTLWAMVKLVESHGIENLSWAAIIIGGAMILMATALALAGKDAMKAGIGFIFLSVAVTIISNAIISLSKNMEATDVAWIAGSLAVLIGVLGLFVHFTEAGKLAKISLSLIIFGGAVVAMAAGLRILAGLSWQSIAAAGGSIAGLMLVLKMMTKIKTSDLLATSASLIIFGVSVAAMSAGLLILGQLPYQNVLASAGAIAALVLAFGALAILTDKFANGANLIAMAGALVIFGAAVATMSFGLSALANVPWDPLWKGALVIGILMALFAGISVVLANVGVAIPVMVAFSLGLVAISAAAVIMATAVVILANAREEIGAFAQMMGENLGNFGAAALAFTMLGGGLVVFGVGVAAFGITAGVAAGGIALLNMALSGLMSIAQQADVFVTAGQNITNGVSKGMIDGQGSAVSAVGTLVQTILGTILSLLGIASPSTVMADQVGQFIPAGIAQGITNNQGETDNSLGSMLGGLIEKFTTWVQTEGLPKLQEFGNGLLEKLRTEILPNIQTWFTETGLPALGEMGKNVVDHLMEKLGELPGKLLEWAGTLPGKIWEGLKAAWDTVTKIGADIVNGIVEGIKAMPSAIADAVIGLASGGLDGIKNFFGIASPSKVMRDEVGKFIPLGLAEGITEFSDVVSKAGRNMAENTTKDINKGLSGIQSDFDINLGGYSNFTPVLDSSSLDSQIESYRSTLSGMNLSTSADVTQQIDASIDTTSLLMASQNQAANIEELYNQNAKLIAEVSRLRDDMSRYTNAINNSAIVMDTGTLVGAIAPQMDGALGMRRTQSSRGVR